MITTLKPISLAGTDCRILANVPLAKLTSFRVGGPAQWYVAPRTVTDLQASFEWVDREGLPVTLLGAGSNLLVSDRGLPGLTISTRYLRELSFDHDTGCVTVGAGVTIAALAWKAADLGWSGLEWSVGIPGTVGGCTVMNAGAHGGEIQDILVSATVLSPDAYDIATLPPSDLGYAYRTSALQGDRRLVTQAVFQLEPGHDPAVVRARTREHLERRHATQPYHLPSCGSVFRNPNAHKAAWLIENAGLKGYQIGSAQVAQLHANFILNLGGATAGDIFRLIEHVRTEVDRHWNLSLIPEVKMLGQFQSV
jgi:UDP-N-acetylmuramate dehydrogenase